MPRPRSKSRDELISSAMGVFWENGFNATSIEDLVVATGVGRGGIYSDFGGRKICFWLVSKPIVSALRIRPFIF
jgi:TetR/AcrR family transcriptional repressor of nem operon